MAQLIDSRQDSPSRTSTPERDSTESQSQAQNESDSTTSSVASSLVSQTEKRPISYATCYFNSEKWSFVHKFITQTCKVQIKLKITENNKEQLYGLKDMIKKVFSDDYTKKHRSVILSPGLWESSSGDTRVRTLQKIFMSEFNLESMDLAAMDTAEEKNSRECHKFQSGILVGRTEDIMMGKSLSTKCQDDIVEIRMVDRLQSFASAYEDLVMNMDKHLQIPSELYYQKCFVSFLEALCLRTIPATPRNQEYLVPTLKWSQSGTTIAQPDGIVVTKLCQRKARKHLAFACLEVKKASKSRHGGRSLPPRHGEPVIPAQCVHDSLATVLPQHFLELFISARETIFTTVRNKDDFKVLYYTKVGLVQQGMNVSVIILKLSEEKFESLVVSKEEGEKRKKATESWNMTQSRKRKTSDDGSSESPESDRAVSKIKKSKCDSNEDLLGESSMGTASTQDAMTEETLDNPVKTVRFQNVEKASSKETSDKLHVKAPQLYISKEYSLLDNQDRIELVQGLIMLEKISESILADRYGKLINP